VKAKGVKVGQVSNLPVRNVGQVFILSQYNDGLIPDPSKGTSSRLKTNLQNAQPAG